MTIVRENFVLFYSSKSIYSNFHPAEFADQEISKIIPKSSKYCGQKVIKFSHVEQYMHAFKALLFFDIPIFDKILSTSDPKITKQLGRLGKQFDDKVWTAIARDIVTRGCFLKFGQNEKLQQQLQADGKSRQFVECAPMDQRWGIGLGIKDPRCLKPINWQGQNWLGRCLDQVWKHLADGTVPKCEKLQFFYSTSLQNIATINTRSFSRRTSSPIYHCGIMNFNKNKEHIDSNEVNKMDKRMLNIKGSPYKICSKQNQKTDATMLS